MNRGTELEYFKYDSPNRHRSSRSSSQMTIITKRSHPATIAHMSSVADKRHAPNTEAIIPV